MDSVRSLAALICAPAKLSAAIDSPGKIISSSQSRPEHQQPVFLFWARRLDRLWLCQYLHVCTYLCTYDVMLWRALADIRLADMPPSKMQGQIPEQKGCSSWTNNEKFEEIVCASMVLPFPSPWLDAHRCTLHSWEGLSSSISQNQTLSKARDKP